MLIAGALLGATGVLLGAWGAHGLASYLGHNNLSAWSTGVLYHLMHALAIVAIAIRVQDHSNVRWSGWLLVIGVVLFSGSLYLLTLGGPKLLGPITPIGGVFLILGWLVLAVQTWRAS